MEEKLFAIIGRIGILATAKKLNTSYPTLKKKIEDFGEFKQNELNKIKEIHHELFGN